jgi:hypothetical protein
MTYTVEMSSCAVIYIPRFIKIVSVTKKLVAGIYRHTNWWSHKPTFFLFFK